MEGLFVLLALALIVGAIMGWVAVLKISSITARLTELERRLAALSEREEAPLPPQLSAPSVQATPRQPIDTPTPAPQRPSQSASAGANRVRRNSTPADKFFAHLAAHWMVWLGGACIGFAGVFLAKHSIEQGILDPTARLVLAITIGLALHIAAEVLRRRTHNPQTHDVFAALAGGASLMLYAALLAGLHLYHLMSPALVFGLLIAVSAATMLLALVHGPVLAAIGILGAFAVPLLVGTGSNNVLGALGYSFIISISALLLVRLVYRNWLWVGALVGALGWWLLTLSAPQQIPNALNLYLVGLAYGACATHWWNWRLAGGTRTASPDSLLAIYRDPLGEGRLALLLAGIAGLYGLNFATHSSDGYRILSAPLLPLLYFCIAYQHANMKLLPWVVFGAGAAGLLLQGMSGESNGGLEWLLLALTITYLLPSLWLLRSTAQPGVWASLAFLSPVGLLAIGYLRLEAFSVHWQWSAATALLGATYMHLVFRQHRSQASADKTPAVVVSLTLAAHCAFSLALVMLVREATLTLALGVQIISLTWLSRQFGFRALEIGAKAVLAVVIIRLSLNPWLLTYSTDVHWSLWTYGGSLLCCLVASQLAEGHFRQWLVGASMHLLVLLLFFEVRYWLYDGEVFRNTYSFTEAAINTGFWGALGLVYYWRAQLSEHGLKVYRLAAWVLLLLALSNYGLVILLTQNPLLTDNAVGTAPIFNLLLLAYGLPPILGAVAYRLLHDDRLKRLAGFIAGAGFFIFCTLEVRHLWQGNLTLAGAMSDGELYSYSMVWLALAVAGSIGAVRFHQQDLYKGSMLLLIVVVAKIFIVDMDGLTGLLRAASFMGLGLSLLGLAYLHKLLHAGTPPPAAAV